MRKGAIILFSVLLLIVGASIFLPSVISATSDKKMLDQVKKADEVAEIGDIGGESMTLLERLNFISRKDVIRTQSQDDQPNEELLETAETEMLACVQNHIFYAGTEDLLKKAETTETFRNCYLDSETFQCVFTDSLVLQMEAGSLEMEFDRETGRLIAFYITTEPYADREFLYAYVSGNMAEYWPDYLLGQGTGEEKDTWNAWREDWEQEGNIDSDILNFSYWFYRDYGMDYDYAPAEDFYQVNYLPDLRYAFVLFSYDYTSGQYISRWVPYS